MTINTMDTLTSEADDAEITAFFAADPETIAWPYPMYRRWREGTGVVRWHGGPATLVTHHADVKDVMAGKYPIRQNAYRYGEYAEGTFSKLPEELHDVFFKVLDFEGEFLSRKDGEEHQRLRRIGMRAFTARRIERLRESIQAHTDDLIEEMLARPDHDIKRDVANRLPVRVICDLIGIPQSDRDQIWEWAEAVGRLLSLDEYSLRAADKAIDDFREYISRTVAELRRTGEGPELAMAMLDSHEDEVMTEEELLAMYLVLLFGGSETTTNLLGNGFLALQTHRAEGWDQLLRDPSLVRGAVDELIRYDSPHHYLPRVVDEDFELHGQTIKKDQTLIVVMGAANHDETVFPDPERLDLTRPNKTNHLSFAFGAHHCLGAALARLEGEIVFSTLLRRFPEARLLDDKPTYGGSAMLRAIKSLPTDLGTPAA